MRVVQRHWTEESGWVSSDAAQPGAGLVLLFGSTEVLDGIRFAEVRALFPDAVIVGCSTAGEILGERVYDRSVTATAVAFDSVSVRQATASVAAAEESRSAGAGIARQLLGPDLAHVLLFSDGLTVNGSELAAGVREALPENVAVTGGLAADGARFERTLVIADAPPRERQVVGVALYGAALRVGYGSLGGWDPFGVDRLITRARNNVLYELDGEPALALYKRYLGEHAQHLPASGLLFPLTLRSPEGNDPGIVRTILAVDEEQQSMTFAGDMPEGMYARLMKANFDRLVDGASGAASSASRLIGTRADLALLISCVGRRLVLKQRVEEELDSVRDVLGSQPRLTGFYSYGEIAPHAPTGRCELHNQTMTITTFTEV